jgi:uncharacterized protein YdhG (YjbR/CyaY superfamily)
MREIDEYLATLDEPKRSTLEALRTSILEVVPEAHSGSVLSELGDDLARYERSKGALRFAIDQPLPKRLVKKLVITRMRQLGLA